jgi:Domain of unknown function (DUF4351)
VRCAIAIQGKNQLNGIRILTLQQRLDRLSVAQLENLAEALLDFSGEADLATWLQTNSNQPSEED